VVPIPEGVERHDEESQGDFGVDGLRVGEDGGLNISGSVNSAGGAGSIGSGSVKGKGKQ
jgi:hypothetical protein